MKHIEIHYHLICEAVEDEKLSVQYVPMDENPADIFTKALAKPIFHHFTEQLGLCNALQGNINLQN